MAQLHIEINDTSRIVTNFECNVYYIVAQTLMEGNRLEM